MKIIKKIKIFFENQERLLNEAAREKIKQVSDQYKAAKTQAEKEKVISNFVSNF